jgi:hypothetical protein
MTNYIVEFKHSIPDLLCEEIIEIFEEYDTKRKGATVGGIKPEVLDSLDMCIGTEENNLWKKKLFSFIQKELINKLSQYEKIVNKYNYNNGFNIKKMFIRNIIIRKYEINKGKYKYHTDELHFLKNKSRRIISFIWYLNNINEGGETIFENNYKIKPEIGKLLLFPSSWTYPHTGSIPISDDKYIIVGWIEEHFTYEE